MPMLQSTSGRIAITGATGMVGQALTTHLTELGFEVVPVSRRQMPGGIRWDPARGALDPAKWEGLQGVVHLAGENLAEGRWTDARKELLRASRIGPTRLLSRTLAQLNDPPEVFLSASAIGIYGNRGDEVLTEESPTATDFLASLATAWEAAADPARSAGIRVVHPRMGIILSATGGALAKMLPTARLGLGAPLGSGQQWWSWIAMADVLGGIAHLIETESLRGPVNLVAPEATRNGEFAAELGRVLHRPVLFPVPALVLKVMLGEMAEATVLASTRVAPTVLQESGYPFRFPALSAALAAAL